MVNFDALKAEIGSVVWGTTPNVNSLSTGFASWQHYGTAL